MMPEDFEEDTFEEEPELNDDIVKSNESLVENDEIEPWEEGFLEGAEGGGQQAKCRKCGKILERNNCIEKVVDGEVCWFCSEHCADNYEAES